MSRVRVWRPDWPCAVARLLGPHRRGAGDPTYRLDREGPHAGRHWRAIRTPEGPATLLLDPLDPAGDIRAEAWGSGAEWLLDRLPALLGADDDWTGFDPRHPLLAEVWRHHPHLRIGRSERIMEALVPAIIEQKVTGQEAFTGFRRLVRRYGEPAPGPRTDLFLQPTAEVLRAIPSWEWLTLHIDPARSRAVVSVARVADSVERMIALPPEEFEQRIRSIPGIGEWTAAEVRQRAFGDSDAVSFGDYHVAKEVGFALTGAAFDDEELRAYLEPWRPYRGRAVLLALLSGRRPERRGPRMAPRTHLPRR